MTDERIDRYQRAIREMAGGSYRVELGIGRPDDIGKLGAALNELGVALERRFSELNALIGVTATINNGLVLAEALDHVYDAFIGLIPYHRIGCALIDDGGERVRTVWARTGADRPGIGVGYSAPLAGSSLAGILQTGEPRILNDLEAYLEDHPTSISTRMIVREGIRSSLTCPLIAHGKPVGFLFFSSREIGTYADVHVDLFKQIASQVSVVVAKGRIYEGLLETKRQLQEANEKLESLANADGLTGVANRRFFDATYEREWSRSQRLSESLSVIMVDIDHFKEFNDLLGHQPGDDCLRRVAETLAQTARRGTDLVARYGGEEFVVLLAGADLDSASKLAEMLRSKVEALGIEHPGSTISKRVTISLGVSAGTPERGSDPTGLVGMADAALYQAKNAGRNRVFTLPWRNEGAAAISDSRPPRPDQGRVTTE